MPLPPRGTQLTFADAKTKKRGGLRPGAGRPSGKGRRNVPHVAREPHVARFPVHITLRRAKGLPSLRTQSMHELLRRAIKQTQREGFRIVEYSIQADHLHILVEADDAKLLSAGMRSFAIRVAMRANGALRRRRGRVWADRHHRRPLTAPSEVRNVLVYILNNHLKHGEWEVGLIDPCSSAPWFTGWMHRREPEPPDLPSTVKATTWLLERGWVERGGGWLQVGEVPRSLWDRPQAPRS